MNYKSSKATSDSLPLLPKEPSCQLNIGSELFWIEILAKDKEIETKHERHLRECPLCSQIVHHLIESGNVKNANLQEKLLLGEKPNGVYNFEESGNWFFRFVKSAERKKRLINLVYYILIAAPVLYGLYKLLKD